jgi:aldehyde:ferredoxin oxidoreductase
MTFGYCGKILEVDLTTGTVRTEPLGMDIARDFIGDFGINSRLAVNYLKPQVGPLSADNVIIFGASPLVGSRIPGVSRCHILTKQPLVGSIWESSGSMALSTGLKAAGYDHLIVKGRASQPVFLCINGAEVTIQAASDLWGKGIFEATDALYARYGKLSSVMAIGPAGENLVRISMCLIDKVGTAGKGGLAAVMGSKNLKAVVVNGSRKVDVYDPDKLRELRSRLMSKVLKDPLRGEKIKLGQMFEWKALVTATKCEYRNWTETFSPEKAEGLFGIDQYLKVRKGRLGCPGCPTPDKDVLGLQSGEFQGLTTYVSGFAGRARDLGIRCGLSSVNDLVKCIDLAGQYGVDTHLFWPVQNLAVKMYQQGIISREDTGGFDLRDGFECTARLLKQIAFREGLGAVLADGTAGVTKRFGLAAAGLAVTVKGQDVQRDGRANILSPSIFEQIVSPEGGGGSQPGTVASPDHWAVGSMEEKWKVYCRNIGVPEEARKRIFDEASGYNVGRLTKHVEEWYTIISSLGICMRHHIAELYDISICAELYSAATGFKVEPAELKQGSERAWNLLKALNAREGFTRKDDRVPLRWIEEPLKNFDGSDLRLKDSRGKLVNSADVEKLLDDYYSERGWDCRTGVPSHSTLARLRLSKLAPWL